MSWETGLERYPPRNKILRPTPGDNAHVNNHRHRHSVAWHDEGRNVFVIVASSLGTVFRVVRLFIFTARSQAIIGAQFLQRLSAGHAWTSSRCSLSPPASLVRPFGAIVFGRVGDIVGRKYTFPGHHPHHGPVDILRRPASERRHHRHRGADHPGRPCACCKVSRSAVNTAVRRLTSPSIRRWASAATTRRSFRRPRRSACFLSLLVILFHPHDSGRSRVRSLGLAHTVSWSRPRCSPYPSGSVCGSTSRRSSRR